jgi:hypothetical protein
MAPPLYDPRSSCYDILDKWVGLFQLRTGERMRFYAEIDFSSEAHQFQVLTETIDIRFIKKYRKINVTVLCRCAR